ncbi:MAG: hypothetical protein U9O56_10050 [Campylobacterota bacterium]|nr:hypothetical protein [Campylobacterota bacterium]
MKLTQQDKARLLGIDARTLRKWRKDRPYLYKIIMLGFGVEKMIEQSNKSNEELKELSEQLSK